MAENARRGRYIPALDRAISSFVVSHSMACCPPVKPLTSVNPLHRHLSPLMSCRKTSGILLAETESIYSSMALACASLLVMWMHPCFTIAVKFVTSAPVAIHKC